MFTITITADKGVTVETASGFMLTEGVDYSIVRDDVLPGGGSEEVGNPQATPAA